MTRASQLAAIGKADAAYAEAWSTLYREACLEWEVLARPDARWTKATTSTPCAKPSKTQPYLASPLLTPAPLPSSPLGLGKTSSGPCKDYLSMSDLGAFTILLALFVILPLAITIMFTILFL